MRRTAEGRAAGWALVALCASGVASADEPREWLERMNQALTQNNYEGEFQHWQRGKVENLRIIHRVQNGQVTERLYDQDYERDSNVIEVFIGRLRRKLDPTDALQPIETLRGRGYRFALARAST